MKITKFRGNGTEITSSSIFKRRLKIREFNEPFHEEGIFSSTIFKNGSGYIHLDIEIPYDELIEDKVVIDLLYYRGFLYNGQYVQFDPKEDLTNYETIFIGKDAVKQLGYSEDWFLDYTYNNIYVPHPRYRPIVENDDGTKVLGPVNNALVNMLRTKKRLAAVTNDNVWAQLAIRRKLMEQVDIVKYEVFHKLAKQKKNSLVDTELRGHAITGSIRAVITNNYGLDEDVAMIGSYFVPILYPRLYQLFDGDLKRINEYLEINNFYVLVNRQPTIGAKSYLGMRPVFTDEQPYVMQLNPIIFDGLAGDCDGDVLSATALYTREANKEASLMRPSRNYLDLSEIRNKIPEDFEVIDNE